MNQPSENVNTLEWMECAFRDVYNKIMEAGRRGSDRMCLSFNYDKLDKNCWVSPRAIEGYEFQDLWNLVSSVAQSAGGIEATDTFWIKLHVFEAPEGSGSTALTRKRKCGVITIRNDDNLCLPRALAVAKVYTLKHSAKANKGELLREWTSIRQPKGKEQRLQALALIASANVSIPNNGCGLEEVRAFQKHMALEGYVIMVYSSRSRGNKPLLYDGTPELEFRDIPVKHTLRIAYDPCERHFEPISSVSGFLGSRHFCTHCNTSYNSVPHVCDKKCDRCLKHPPCDSINVNKVLCSDCNREFHGQGCFDHHKTPGSFSGRNPTVCSNIQMCSSCSTKIFRDKGYTHVCHSYYCSSCQQYKQAPHYCYMPTLKVKDKFTQKRVAFVFYDFETRQDDKMEGSENVNVHVPTLCVVQTVCDRCASASDDDMTEDAESICETCNPRLHIFNSVDPVREFVNYVVSLKNSHYKKIICIAHNAKGYDAQFIMRDVMHRVNDEISAIINGTNIILMEFDKNKFIDSLNYLHMPLSGLPKAFGLGDIAKGYFPHFFNTRENQHYIGPIPAVKYYGADTWSTQERSKFLVWHAQKVAEQYVFDFQAEILHYCKLDVTILRRACMEFRQMLLDTGNVCPFTQCTTIASTCMRVFQVNHLEERTIGIIPSGGYRLADNQSRVGLEWLLWLENLHNCVIQHAGRSNEFRTETGHIVDGYYEDPVSGKRTVFQFHGCFYHGCRRCFPYNRDQEIHKNNKETYNSRFERTERNAKKLRGAGYEVIEMWECDFALEKRENEILRNFLARMSTHIFLPLDPREAFFGGRTGNTVSYYDVKLGEQIRYVDVCSLYPYVLKTGVFPIGHPTVFVGDDCLREFPNNDISSIEGLIKCRVLPPRRLLHPILPVKAHDKLYFSLCRSCTEGLIRGDCPHNDPQDREIVGTWVAPELRKAIELGYRVLEIYEVWHYSRTSSYDPVQKSGGLFTDYINTFLKIKQEASGWPSNCIDDVTRQKYLEEFEKVEGIKLDPSKIKKNPGLRSVAKLCLNCLWGKFGERQNLTKKAIVRTYEEFADIMFDCKKEVTGLVPIDNDVLFISWKYIDAAATASPKSNVVIAAYTTAHARLKLYSYLEKLQDRVLYYDTDSVIYVSDGTNELPLGNFLGDLTDEVEEYGEGSYISSFVSGGPKFYTYRIVKPDGSNDYVSKIKGVRLNYETRKKIHYDSIRSLVVDRADPVIINSRAIRRNMYHSIISINETKRVNVTGPKRKLDAEGCTKPYGYSESPLKKSKEDMDMDVLVEMLLSNS